VFVRVCASECVLSQVGACLRECRRVCANGCVFARVRACLRK